MISAADMPIMNTDVLVIGGGTAGPMAAVTAKEANPALDVLLLEKANVKRSAAISMGMDGLNNAIIPGHATPENYVKEITIANDGIVNQKAALNGTALMAKDDPLLRKIAERLQSPDAGIRRVAVMDLIDCDGKEAAALLVTALKDTDSAVRQEAAKILDEFDADVIAEALVEALTADDEHVRNAAARALTDLKYPSAAPALLAALKGDDAFVLAAILRALKVFRTPDAEKPALRYLDHPVLNVRREAVAVLGYLKLRDALPALMKTACKDADPEVRRAAVGALIYGEGGLVALGLIDALQDTHWQVRSEAAVALGKLRCEAGVAALVGATRDRLWQVQEKSVEALGRIGAIDPIPAIGACTNHDVSNVRKAALGALGEIGHADARPYVDAAFDDPDPDVRKLARWARDKLERAASAQGLRSVDTNLRAS
jgi:HEAT repeat protein